MTLEKKEFKAPFLPDEESIVTVNAQRTNNILIITKRLIVLAALSLVIAAGILGLTFYYQSRLMLTWMCFEFGIIGGFVSIQQRLKTIHNDELIVLSVSWSTILIIPVYGGIFALVLYVLFLSGLLGGHLFPKFWLPPFDAIPTTQNIVDLLSKTYPSTGEDLAKLIFWSFVSGFSERFVPQIIQTVVKQKE